MITLKYIVDDKFLASYIITHSGEEAFIPNAKEEYIEQLVKFQNIAWNESELMYKFMDGRVSICEIAAKDNSSYSKIGNDAEFYLEKLIKKDEFKVLRKQTEDIVELIKKEWDSNFEKTYEYIKNLGINIHGEFEILLAHPGLKTGHYIGNNKIRWTYQNYYPNYNTVYIWHEILHSYFKSSNPNHALIEMISDEEIRHLLNGDKYPPFIGHPHLEKLKTKGLGIWKNYLLNKSKNIESLENSFNKIDTAS